MSIDSSLIEILRGIDGLSPCSVESLPEYISPSHVEDLGDMGYVEIRCFTHWGGPSSDHFCEWYWPHATLGDRLVAGDWETVFRKYAQKPENPLEIRVSGEGKKFLLNQIASSQNAATSEIDDKVALTRGYFDFSELAKRHQVPKEQIEAMRKRLQRWRKDNIGSADWKEVESTKPGDSKFLFRESAVVHLFKLRRK